MKIKRYKARTPEREYVVVAREVGWKNRKLPELIDIVKGRSKPAESYDDSHELFTAIDQKQEELLKIGLLHQWFNPRTKSFGPVKAGGKRKKGKHHNPYDKSQKENPDADVVGVPAEQRKGGLGHFIATVTKSSLKSVSKPINDELHDSKVAIIAMDKVINGDDLTADESRAAKKIMHHVGIGVCAALVAAGAYVFLGPLALIAGNEYLDYRQKIGANYGDGDEDDGEDAGEDDDEEGQKTTQEVLEEKEEEDATKDGVSLQVNDEGRITLADGSEVEMTPEEIQNDIATLSIQQLRDKYGDSLQQEQQQQKPEGEGEGEGDAAAEAEEKPENETGPDGTKNDAQDGSEEGKPAPSDSDGSDAGEEKKDGADGEATPGSADNGAADTTKDDSDAVPVDEQPKSDSMLPTDPDAESTPEDDAVDENGDDAGDNTTTEEEPADELDADVDSDTVKEDEAAAPEKQQQQPDDVGNAPEPIADDAQVEPADSEPKTLEKKTGEAAPTAEEIEKKKTEEEDKAKKEADEKEEEERKKKEDAGHPEKKTATAASADAADTSEFDDKLQKLLSEFTTWVLHQNPKELKERLLKRRAKSNENDTSTSVTKTKSQYIGPPRAGSSEADGETK